MHMGLLKIDNFFSECKYISEESLVIMGKGPKHSNSKPRNNAIFKVAGQNFKTDKKGKPKEVTSKLKLVRFKERPHLHDFNVSIRRSHEEMVKRFLI